MNERRVRYQTPGSPVFVGEWERSDEYGTFPIGSKPKQMIICPEDATEPFLIPGHAYLFKWAEDWQERQIWSEIIACRIAQLTGITVPPCFLAVDETTGRAGALVEIFYGYPNESPRKRFVHASDIMRLKDPKKGRPHDIYRNHAYAKRLGVREYQEWWGRVLAFDALIGNTDRHPENWGLLFGFPRLISIHPSTCKRLIPFLVDVQSPVNTNFSVAFAPAFDNATSLGYEVRDADLVKYMEADRLTAYIDKGTHHCDWDSGQPRLRQHLELCRRYFQMFPTAGKAMKSVLNFRQEDVESILKDCTAFDVKPPFTSGRVEFVSLLIRERQRRLMGLFKD